MAEEAAAERLPIRPRIIGRYALFGEIAAGGMATVHFGRLVGPVGFSRTVAIKRLHAQFAKDPEFVGMFLDEARLASRIQHPNVVSTLDVVNMPNEVFLVMEYVPGESLAKLVRNAGKAGELVPPGHAAAIVAGLLHGLHAAHEAKSERREPLNIVHRDVSPQNVLVGTDGTSRVLDFGVAKAAMRTQSTQDGQMKGKISYMSPEQLNGRAVDRRTDIFAAGVVLWETLTGKRLFDGSDAGEIFAKLLAADIPEPKSLVPSVPDALNDVVMKALERDPDRRYQTARDFAIELEGSTPIATPRGVGEWIEQLAGADLERRAQYVAEIESIETAEEDLESLDDDPSIEPIGEPVERSSLSSASAVQSVSGPRPKLPPPPELPPSRPPDEERSQASLPRAASSQISGLVQQRSPSRDISPVIWIAAAVACIGGGVIAFLLFGRAPKPPAYKPLLVPHAAEVAFPAAAAAAAQAQAPQPAAEAVNAVRVQDLPPAPPDDEDPELESQQRRRASSRARSASKPETAASSKVATPTIDCNPPFTIDGAGIKRPKPGCL